jgi:hypothetical protein
LGKIDIVRLLLDTFKDHTKSDADVQRDQLHFIKQAEPGKYSALQQAIKQGLTGLQF